MEVSDRLIEQFFSGGGTEEERRLVADYLKNNPDKLNQYLTEQSWESFNPDSRKEQVPTYQIRQSIERKIGRAPVRSIMNNRMAAAAVISLVCLVAFFRWYAGREIKSDTRPVIEATAQATIKEEKTSGPQPVIQSIRNESSKIKIYSLPDGSKLELGGHSMISFSQPFINNRRDFFLTGDAVFTVMKDKARPFAVHSKGIITTALGTVFRVNDKNRLFTTVRLFSGRIVIKKEVPDAGKSFKDIYLTPGQELVLNNEVFSVQIKADQPKLVLSKEERGPLQPQILKFSRQSLAEIFSILKKEYKTKISYNSADMKNIDFTGTFDQNKETLESFLNTLCILNELKIKKTNSNGFSIKEK
ncbi:MAG: FecR family protein [Bacteroidota bacterium]|nr:FecR family protein [Bacteroidota bacterium]